MIGRRGLLGGLAAVVMPGRGKQDEAPQVMAWEAEDCPGCGLVVYFLPRQRKNRCGWCGRAVRHAVG